MADHIEENNVGTIEKKNELRKAIAHGKSEDEAEHERNIDNITQVDDYKSPWKNKYTTYATTVNNTFDDTGFTFFDSFQDDTSVRVNRLRRVKSQSKILRRLKSQSKMILTFSKEFVIYKMDPLIWTQSSPESESLDKEDLGLLAGEVSPKVLFRGGKV